MVLSSNVKLNNWHRLSLLLTLIFLGLLTAVSPTLGLLILTGIFSIPILTIIFYRPYWVVLFLTAYMPFESLILKFLPVSGQLYLIFQLISEALIYITFLFIILKKLLQNQPFRRTPVDTPLILFISVAFLSIIWNQSPLINSLMQLRTLLRYTFLFYLVVNLNLSSKQAKRILNVLIAVGLIQLLLGGLQLTIGGPINQLLLPRQVEAEIAGQSRNFILVSRGREIGSIYGSLGDTVYYGYFLLFFLAVYLARMKTISFVDFIIISTIFLTINYSFSRAAVFGFLFIIVIFFRSKFGLNRSILLTLTLLPTLVLAILFILSTASNSTFINPVQQEQGIFDNISGVFTTRYIEIAQKQRLGHLLGTAPTIIANKPWLGFGPDEETTINQINQSDPNYLLTPLTGRTANTFEDVFWVALLGYYGIIGVSIWIYLLYKLYRAAWKIYQKTNNPIHQQISLSVLYSVSLAPILLFFNQTLEFRIYGFYFWLLPALMITLLKQNAPN